MKYLGTAAYEGVPSLFCTCDVCEEARKKKCRYCRSRSQALINGELLLDFPPDTVWHAMRFDLDWRKIHDCLITHSHSDHLYPEDVEMASEDYSGKHFPIRFYLCDDGVHRLDEIARKPFMKDSVIVKRIEPGKPFDAGNHHQYMVLPLWANHDLASSPVIYAISFQNEKLLYAHDTGIFPEETWSALKNYGVFQIVSLDCTGGIGVDGEWRDGHMCLRTNLEVVKRMKREGLLNKHTKIILNHFSHQSGQGYEEMKEEAEKYGFAVAYDGMEVEV